MPEPNPHTNKKILVVEDDKATREIITGALQAEGLIVTSAWKKEEVLALIRFSPFDLVLTDVIMPEIDGSEVIRALKKYHPLTPVLAISGGGAQVTNELSLKLAESVGAFVVLSKPFHFAELLTAVWKALGDGKPSETPERPPEA